MATPCMAHGAWAWAHPQHAAQQLLRRHAQAALARTQARRQHCMHAHARQRASREEGFRGHGWRMWHMMRRLGFDYAFMHRVRCQGAPVHLTAGVNRGQRHARACHDGSQRRGVHARPEKRCHGCSTPWRSILVFAKALST